MNSNQRQSFPFWSARQVILATLLVVTVGLAFWLLFRYRMVIVILFIALVLGTALRPIVDWFARRGLSRAFGLSIVYLLLFGLLIGLVFLVVPMVIDQSLELVVSIPGMYQNVRSYLFDSPSVFLRNLAFNLPGDLAIIFTPTSAEEESLDSVARFFNLAAPILSTFLVLLAIFLLTSFWILESQLTLRNLFFYFPPAKRQAAADLVTAIEERVGAFIRGQLLLSFIIGCMAFVIYLLIGLPNALVLAIIAGIFEAVPVIGPTLGAIPALLVAFSGEPNQVIWVVIGTVVIQTSENYFIVPRVMGSSVGVHPMITLLVLATFTSLLGIPGALLAIPFAAIFQLLLERYVLSKQQNIDTNQSGRDLSSAVRYELKDLIGDVRKQVRQKSERSNTESDQIEDAIESLAVELDDLLNQNSQKEDQ